MAWSCPITRCCKTCSICNNFSFSPSCIFPTGILVFAATTLAKCSSSTFCIGFFANASSWEATVLRVSQTVSLFVFSSIFTSWFKKPFTIGLNPTEKSLHTSDSSFKKSSSVRSIRFSSNSLSCCNSERWSVGAASLVIFTADIVRSSKSIAESGKRRSFT